MTDLESTDLPLCYGLAHVNRLHKLSVEFNHHKEWEMVEKTFSQSIATYYELNILLNRALSIHGEALCVENTCMHGPLKEVFPSNIIL